MTARSHGPAWRAVRRFVRRPVAVLSALVFLGILVIGIFGPHIAPYFVNNLDYAFINHPHAPTLAGDHFFGTDGLGRDIFSQTLYGLHNSLPVAFLVAAVATTAGVVVGAVAGYAGGWLDAALMRIVDLVATVPAIAIIFALIVYLSPLTELRVGYILMAWAWTIVARVVRGNVLALRDREYVEAARAVGASPLRIVVRHLLPGCSPSVLVAATTVFAQAIALAAFADFVGAGTTQLNSPTLGNIIADEIKFQGLQTPWWTYVFPSVVLVALLASASFAADAIGDAFTSPTG